MGTEAVKGIEQKSSDFNRITQAAVLKSVCGDKGSGRALRQEGTAADDSGEGREVVRGRRGWKMTQQDFS